MHKALKIVFAVFAVLLIVAFSGFALVVFDVAGGFATGSHPLPNDSAVGKAIVVYDPGLSGKAKDAASQIGFDIQDSGYSVTLAGVKSSDAADVSGYDIVVVGGPIYAGKPASSIQDYLQNLSVGENVTVGVFGYGSVQVTGNSEVAKDVANLPADSNLDLAATAKITSNRDFKEQCQNFVDDLLG
jgi:flavodoxin